MASQPDFSSETFNRDPAAGIAMLRAQGEVVEVRFPIVGRVWLTTTYDAASVMLKESATFTLRKEDGEVAGLRWWMPKSITAVANNMLTMDEPDHTRLRSIVDEAFRRRAVLDMEPHIRGIADRLADELFATGSPADLIPRYARILPVSVICELLGLPLADRPTFIAWASAMTQLRGPISFLRMMGSLSKMRKYLAQQLQFARERGGEGLIAELVQVEKEGGRITPDEMVSMVFLLLGAGSETTTHLISGSVFELLKDHARRDWLTADWNRLGLAVEEFLRFVSPVQFTKPRYVRRDVEFGGVHLKKGDRVMAMIAAANIDPTVHERPERMDLARKPNRHISFGTGIHFCLPPAGTHRGGICAASAVHALARSPARGETPAHPLARPPRHPLDRQVARRRGQLMAALHARSLPRLGRLVGCTKAR